MMVTEPHGTGCPALQRQVPLAPLTSLGLGGPAQYLVETENISTLVDALRWARRQELPVTVLGGGSNVVVADRGIPGLVLRVALSGTELRRHDDSVQLQAAAGEAWDDLVSMAVSEGLAGIECLAGIPGTAGAAPIQNIGAYGREVAESLTGIRVLDRRSLTETTLRREELDLGYRSSRLRRDPGRYVVLAITLELTRGGEPLIRYPELQRALHARSAVPELATVRETVLELRRSKSMVLDPDDVNSRSAGSFFINPVLSPDELQALAGRALAAGAVSSADAVPQFPAGPGRTKVPAAWLIEAAGFTKGLRRGGVGLSERHVLALVNYGGGTSRQLLDLATEIRTTVRERFGVLLHPEPILLGFPTPDPHTRANLLT